MICETCKHVHKPETACLEVVKHAPFIEAGYKQQTIRAHRKQGPRVGEILHCYTGLRQRKGPAQLLGRFTCTKIQEIRLSPGSDPMRVWLDGEELSNDEAETLAHHDGFATLRDMRLFWQENHGNADFFGVIIHWKGL